MQPSCCYRLLLEVYFSAAYWNTGNLIGQECTGCDVMCPLSLFELQTMFGHTI